MTKVNITRQDRGLDYKRIEKIIEMIENRISNIKWDRNDEIKQRKKKLKEKVIEKFELRPHFDAINTLEESIEKLENEISLIKKKKDPHIAAIAKIMRGSEKDTWDYSDVRIGSPAHDYITQYIPDSESMKKELEELSENIQERLWLAKDINEASDIYHHAIERIDQITGMAKETNNE